MNGAFYISSVGLTSQQNALDVIANNISNMNTQGFKRSGVRFSEIISMRSAPEATFSNTQNETSVAGVTTNVALMLNEQGGLERTDRPLDLAIEGNGFIELIGAKGQTLLWRGGALRVGEDGMLMTEGGLALKSMINVPLSTTQLEITSDGAVLAYENDADDPVDLGQIMLVRLDDVSQVERLGGGLYKVDDMARVNAYVPGEDGAGVLVQGAIERSNVDLNTEMVKMMIVQRAYAANAQMVQAADQVMAIVNNLRR